MNCGLGARTPRPPQEVRAQERGKQRAPPTPPPPQEWPDPKDWSLQDTDAFVLVYDICSPDSFDYVKALRQRIAEAR